MMNKLTKGALIFCSVIAGAWTSDKLHERTPLEIYGVYRGYHNEAEGIRTIFVENPDKKFDEGLESAIVKCDFDFDSVDTKSNDYLKIQGYKNFWGMYATNVVKERR